MLYISEYADKKAAEKRSLRLFCGRCRIFGPSGAIRTRGFQLPKLAPYRLGYTRKFVRRNSLRSVSAWRRKLHIRSFLLPLQIEPASLGFDLALLSCIIPRSPLWSSMWSPGGFAEYSGGGKTPAAPANKGLPEYRSVAAAPAAYMLPKHPRYQLRHTRIGGGGSPSAAKHYTGFPRRCKAPFLRRGGRTAIILAVSG